MIAVWGAWPAYVGKRSDTRFSCVFLKDLGSIPLLFCVGSVVMHDSAYYGCFRHSLRAQDLGHLGASGLSSSLGPYPEMPPSRASRVREARVSGSSARMAFLHQLPELRLIRAGAKGAAREEAFVAWRMCLRGFASAGFVVGPVLGASMP